MKFRLLTLTLLTPLLLTSCWTNQTGEKSGVIVKVAKQGFWWGTYEGELVRGGLNNGSGANGTSFHFSLGQFRNDQVKLAEEALQNNKHVVIKYHCEQWVAPWRGGNSCFVDAIA